MQTEFLRENILRIFPGEEPLSSDVLIIKASDAVWVFDAGATAENAEYLQNIDGEKNLVISHFHRDHTRVLQEYDCGFSRIYASPYTFRHLPGIKGNAELVEIRENTAFEDIEIMPIASSHAKGCMALKYQDVLLAGDAVYAKSKLVNGEVTDHEYNEQLLIEEIKQLTKCEAAYIGLSHQTKYLVLKETVIAFLKSKRLKSR